MKKTTTNEQRAADESLRAHAPAYRVTQDAEGWPIIVGRRGQIEYYDGESLAVFTDRPRMHVKLLAVPGVRRHQCGDDELRALFPPKALPQVAQVIRAHLRRKVAPLSPERSAANLVNLAKGRAARLARRPAA